MKKRAITSSSNLEQRDLCPGSATLEAQVAEDNTEASEEGRMLHGLFMTGIRGATLTVEQNEALNLADFYANEFLNNFRKHLTIPEEARYFDEREVGMIFKYGDLWHPGHADFIRTWPDHSARAIIDAKFGFMEVDFAPYNLQLADYAVMRFQQSAVQHTGVAIIQPRNFGPRSTSAYYGAESMPDAAKAIYEIQTRTLDKNAPLIPGEKQCHFCRAKAICPAYRDTFDTLEARPLAVETLPAQELERLHTAISFAKKLGDQVSDEMRRRILAGDMPGYELQNSGDDVALNDTIGFFNMLRDQIGSELTADLYDDCRVMGWGKLTKLIQNITRLSEKKVKDMIKTLSAGFVTRTEKQKKVVRSKVAVMKSANPKQIQS